MAVIDVLARLRADTGQFISGIDNAAKATARLEKSVNQTSGLIGNKLKLSFAAATVAAGAFAVKLGRDSVQAAQQASAAQNRLRKLLFNTNGATEAQVQILLKQGRALEGLTGISQDNITVIQSQLATFDLHGSTIGALTPAILDYVVAEKGAAAGADEFRQMTNGLAQALAGNFGSLTKTGFVLDAQTKKTIKSGSETERAAALVKVLGSTYRDFASSALPPAVVAQRRFALMVGDTKKALGEALTPAITSVTNLITTTFTPVVTKLQEKLADGTSIQNFIKYIGDLLNQLKIFGQSIITVFAPVFTNVIIPAIKLAIGAVVGFIKILGSIGAFIQKNATFFTMIATAIVTYLTLTKAAALATLGFGKVLFQVRKLQQAYAFFTYASTGATTKFAFAQSLLSKAMKANPIGLIISALAAVAIGFKLAWEKSTTFRKVVIGAIQLVVSSVAKAFRVLGNLPGGLGDFFDKAAVSADNFAKGLEKYKNVTTKTVSSINQDLNKMPDLSGLGTTDRQIVDEKAKKAAEAAAKKLAEMKQTLKKAVDDYSDFMKFEFSESFMKGSDAARDSVLNALDKLSAVFEAKGKMLSGPALAKLRASFNKVNADVRGMMEQYATVAGQIEKIVDDIKEANTALQKATEDRATAISKFGDLLRTPFGEPSEIEKALRDGEATVDSIISMYDTLVATVNQRFAGMEQGAKSLIVNYLTDQTAALVKLVKRRSLAIEALKDAESDLAAVLEAQASFQSKLTGSIKDFTKALINLSSADTKAVLTVTKTGSGLVITQVKKASTGVDAITKQLTDRLTQVVAFGKNIEKLLAAGLSKEYIQQLLEAGPEAASETAALLTTASKDQITAINSLYTQINTQAETFGKSMSNIFYSNSVAMAQAFVNGAKAEVASINNQMILIVDGIKSIMSVLGNTGLTSAQALIDALILAFGEVNQKLVGLSALGITNSITTALSSLRTLGTSLATDLAQGLYDKLKSEEARLVALAQSIAAQIAAAMAAAMSMSGIEISSGGGGGGGGGDEPSLETKQTGPTQPTKKVVPTPTIVKRATKPVGALPKGGGVAASGTKLLGGGVAVASAPRGYQNPAMPSGGFAYGRSMAGAAPKPVTVNITTNKVTPTVTPKTVASAVSKATNTRR